MLQGQVLNIWVINRKLLEHRKSITTLTIQVDSRTQTRVRTRQRFTIITLHRKGNPLCLLAGTNRQCPSFLCGERVAGSNKESLRQVQWLQQVASEFIQAPSADPQFTYFFFLPEANLLRH